MVEDEEFEHRVWRIIEPLPRELAREPDLVRVMGPMLSRVLFQRPKDGQIEHHYGGTTWAAGGPDVLADLLRRDLDSDSDSLPPGDLFAMVLVVVRRT